MSTKTSDKAPKEDVAPSPDGLPGPPDHEVKETGNSSDGGLEASISAGHPRIPVDFVKRRNDGTKYSSPFPPSTRAASHLRRSSKRIPERLVPLPLAKDADILDPMTPPTDEEEETETKPPPCKLSGKPSPHGFGTSSLTMWYIQQGNGDSEEKHEPFEVPYVYAETARPLGYPDCESFPNQGPYPARIRHLASKSGFSARMDTISERSAEYEASVHQNSRPVTRSSTKSGQLATVQNSSDLEAADTPLPPVQISHPIPAQAAPTQSQAPPISVPAPPPPTQFPLQTAMMEPPNNEDLDKLSTRTTSAKSSPNRLLPKGSPQSIGSTRSLSSGTLSPSHSLQDQLRLELMALKGILSSVQPLQLPDSMFDNSELIEKSDPFAPVGSRSNSIKTEEEASRLSDDTTLAAQFSSRYRCDKGKSSQIRTETLVAVKAVGEPAQSDSFSVLEPKKEGHNRLSRETHGYSTLIMAAPKPAQTPNPFQLPLIPEVGKGAKLGLDFGIKDEPKATSKGLDEDASGIDTASCEDEPDTMDEASHVKCAQLGSRATSLTCELMKAINCDSPLIPYISSYHIEEKEFVRNLVSFSCDPRAKHAAPFVTHFARSNFRRVHNPFLAFGFEVSRYCMDYVGGYDLSHFIRRMQANRDADEWNRFRGNNHYRLSRPGGNPSSVKYESMASRPSVPRDCGCDTTGSCAHAGSSSYGDGAKSPPRIPLRLPDMNVSSFDDEGEDHQRGNSFDRSPEKYEVPPMIRRASTPPRDSGRESNSYPHPDSLEKYAFLGEKAKQKDKGKGVDRTMHPHMGLDDNRLDVVKTPEGDKESKNDTSPKRSPRKNLSRRARDDDCPRLPPLDLSLRSLSMSTTSSFKSPTTAGTPTTPRTHVSTAPTAEFPPRIPPPPLSAQQNLTIGNAIKIAEDAMFSLRVFMEDIEDAWLDSLPEQQDVPEREKKAPRQNTPEMTRARMRCYELMSASAKQVTAAILVLHQQTLRLRGVLDAVDRMKNEPRGEIGGHDGESSLLPSLLRKTRLGQPETPVFDKNGFILVDVMMTGGLAPRKAPSIRGSPDHGSEDKHGHCPYPGPDLGPDHPRASPNKRRHSHPCGRSRTPSGSRHLGTPIRPGPSLRHHYHRSCSHSSLHSSSRSKSRTGNIFKRLLLLKKTPTNTIRHILTAKLSYTCARAELAALKQMARFSRLDWYTYRSVTRFENKLDRLQEDLLGLDNHTHTHFSHGHGHADGSSPSGRGKADSTDGGESRTTDPLLPTTTLNSSSHHHHTTPDSSSLRSKQRGLQEMRSATSSIAQNIIARRTGRKIGIADTEERLSLSSQEWDWFDSATGKVIPGGREGLRLDVVLRSGTGSDVGGSTGGEETVVRHAIGCRFAHGGFGSGSGPGLGGQDGDNGSRVGVSAGTGSKPLEEHKGSTAGPPEHPTDPGMTQQSSREPSSPPPLPPPAPKVQPTNCPGCHVSLVPIPYPTPLHNNNTHPHPHQPPTTYHRYVGPDTVTNPAATVHDGQLGWVRRVMGPRGRKRAGRYCFYPPAFETPHLRGRSRSRPRPGEDDGGEEEEEGLLSDVDGGEEDRVSPPLQYNNNPGSSSTARRPGLNLNEANGLLRGAPPPPTRLVDGGRKRREMVLGGGGDGEGKGQQRGSVGEDDFYDVDSGVGIRGSGSRRRRSINASVHRRGRYVICSTQAAQNNNNGEDDSDESKRRQRRRSKKKTTSLTSGDLIRGTTGGGGRRRRGGTGSGSNISGSGSGSGGGDGPGSGSGSGRGRDSGIGVSGSASLGSGSGSGSGLGETEEFTGASRSASPVCGSARVRSGKDHHQPSRQLMTRTTEETGEQQTDETGDEGTQPEESSEEK